MVSSSAPRTPAQAQTETWRLFAAAPVNDATRALLREAQERLRPRSWAVRWVDPALAHLTLQFYGDTPTDRLPALERRLGEIARAATPLRLTTAQLGAFPSPRRARVLWLGLAGELEALDELARAVATTASLAPRADVKPFRPHITLGRARDGATLDGVEEALAETRLPAVALPVERIELVRSVLGRSGPTYTTLAALPLGRAATSETREHG